MMAINTLKTSARLTQQMDSYLLFKSFTLFSLAEKLNCIELTKPQLSLKKKKKKTCPMLKNKLKGDMGEWGALPLASCK